ncbi:MAG: D-tyrosyl-tRNA(Tyr) deacylase [Bacilli bacterium]|nr:D-tyrosyl-tRNA(Tyr) deacylase [Bacilli bacterium]
MKVVVQRSKHSSVTVDNELINEIDSGLVLLVGICNDDTEDDIDYLVKKVINLRIFDDEKGIMNKSILDVGGSILSISQFTLQATTRNGNRPSYINAMKGDEALKIYELFNSKLKEYVATYPGVFGADMKVNILNDGPVTIIIDSKDK